MKTAKMRVVVLSFALSLSACVHHGTPFNMGQVMQIQRNITTEQHIRLWFGEPVAVQTNLKAGTKVMVYQYDNNDAARKEAASLGGALLGGILGAQFSDGYGQALATTVGATAGGALAGNAVDARQETQTLTVVINMYTGRVMDFNFEESKGRTQAWGINSGVGTL